MANVFAQFVKKHYSEAPASLTPRQKMKWLGNLYRSGKSKTGGRIYQPTQAVSHNPVTETIIDIPMKPHDGIGIKKKKKTKKSRGKGMEGGRIYQPPSTGTPMVIEVPAASHDGVGLKKKKKTKKRGRGLDENDDEDMGGGAVLVSRKALNMEGGASKTKHKKGRGVDEYAALDPFGSSQYGLVGSIYEKAGGSMQGGALVEQLGGFMSGGRIGGNVLSFLL